MPNDAKRIGEKIAEDTDREADQALENLQKILDGNKPYSPELRRFLAGLYGTIRMQKASTEYYRSRLAAANQHIEGLKEILDRRQ